jgi:hypothetical protein
MDKIARAKLLRDRLRAIRGPSFALRLSPAKPKDRTEWRPFENSIHFTVDPNAKELRQNWLYRPIAAKPSTGPTIRRIARKSPLTAISEQLPAKLPRVLLPSL